MVNLKTNFKSQFKDLHCRVCNEIDSIEDEEHILQCGEFGDYNEDKISFVDVYGDVDEQMKAVKVFKKILRRRESYLTILKKTSNPLS